MESAGIQARTPGPAPWNKSLVAIPWGGAAQGEKMIVKGYYRMIDLPADDAVTMEAILAPQRKHIIEHMWV